MPSRLGHRLLALSAAALLLGAAVAGCSDDKDDSAGRTTTTAASGTTASGDSGDATTTSAANPDPSVPAVGAAERPYVEALVATYRESDAEIYSKKQIECLAARWVPIIGVDRFEERGITPKDLQDNSGDMSDLAIDESTARKMVDAMGACGIDLVGTVITGVMGMATPEQKECVRKAIDPDAVKEALVASLQGKQGDPNAAMGDAEKCFPAADASSSSTTP